MIDLNRVKNAKAFVDQERAAHRSQTKVSLDFLDQLITDYLEVRSELILLRMQKRPQDLFSQMFGDKRV